MFEGEEVLEKLIVGRVEPHIYAFSTNTIPNYLKIGDTYRPVTERLEEWKKHYPNLHKEFTTSAKIENVFFRDFAVHKFLENDLQKIRLLKDSDDFPGGNTYYSKEFFKDTNESEIQEAIKDIHKDYSDKSSKYSFYNVETLREEPLHYQRGIEWDLRNNQKEAVENFKKAIDNGRTNLLMYAVMRFGKSFTSLCCAKEIENLKLIVVVSAKADVLKEWQKNTESPGNFKNFEFETSKSLLENEHLISEHLTNSSNKVMVLFLTLQDLQGNLVKEKHKELFSQDTNIDLLIIDETHFGARADKYGAVLKQSAKAINKFDKDEIKDIDDFKEEIDKTLKAKYKLHLSGTPYRILMGSEFQKEDIISFCQYSDIVDEQKKWDNDKLLKDVDDEDKPIKEWDNPYYGFPQMIRFAFNPNKSSRARMEKLKKEGISFALSKLLEPKSTTKDSVNNNHKQFIYEDEVLELLEVIDGSKNDSEILSFLDYEKIKEGNMCRHIVMVLPYCASCDAMENLIISNLNKFKNLNDYKIINISGIDKANKYSDTEAVKEAIADCEKENKKTITLTVNRMLTGSTVEQWDTMIYLKDTASPQEYDQAIFRLQSQYIKTYKDENGDTIKYNMKPQTLLVDFCIDRIFKMQELKSQIYNVNIDEAGNSKLKNRIERELQISPIIIVNNDKIEQVTATNILDAISNYSKNRGVAEETNDIPVDLGLREISEIWDVISRENELGSKNGFNLEPVEGEGDDIETPDEPTENYSDESTTTNEDNNVEEQSEENNNKNDKDPVKQFRMYYARILYYSFLTTSDVNSIDDIITSIETKNNNRIFINMGLSKEVLIALKDNMNEFMLSRLDYKIQNMNKLSNDANINPLDRVNTANQKFGKLGESEVVTPEKITTDMIELLPDSFLQNCVENHIPILDIASKEAEFAVALYKRFKSLGLELDEFKDLIYSIPTSNITYEFTRKIYEILGLNIENITEKLNSYDLLNIKNGNDIDYEKIKLLLSQSKKFNEITLQDEVQTGGDEDMVKFGAVVGNPPYQEEKKVNNRKGAIYHFFYNIAENLCNIYTLISPARFLFNTGLTPKDWNQKMLNDSCFKISYYMSDASIIFPNTDIKGGIVISYRDANSNFGSIKNFIPDKQLKNILDKFTYNENNNLTSIMYGGRSDLKFTNKFVLDYPHSIQDRINKIKEKHPKVNKLSPNEEYELKSSTFEVLPYAFLDTKPEDIDSYKILGLVAGKRVYKWIPKKYMTPRYPERNNISAYKVFVPESNGSGVFGETLSTPLVAEPEESCTPTFISIGNFQTKAEAENALKYIKTKFSRTLLGVMKKTQHNSAPHWGYIPLQDFTENSNIDWSKSIEDIDKQLYQKYNLTDDEIEYIESMIKPME